MNPLYSSLFSFQIAALIASLTPITSLSSKHPYADYPHRIRTRTGSFGRTRKVGKPGDKMARTCREGRLTVSGGLVAPMDVRSSLPR